MQVVMSLLFHMNFFPHQGNVVMSDHLYFCNTTSKVNVKSKIPFVDNSKFCFDSIMVRMFKDSYIMVNFPLPPLKCYIDSISMSSHLAINTDPLIISSTSPSKEDCLPSKSDSYE